jgi:hypothetical protein
MNTRAVIAWIGAFVGFGCAALLMVPFFLTSWGVNQAGASVTGFDLTFLTICLGLIYCLIPFGAAIPTAFAFRAVYDLFSGK